MFLLTITQKKIFATRRNGLFVEEFDESRFLFVCAKLFREAETAHKLDSTHLSSQREALASFDARIGVTAQPVAGPSRAGPTGTHPPPLPTTATGEGSERILPLFLRKHRESEAAKEAARAGGPSGGASTSKGPLTRARPSTKLKPYSTAGPSGAAAEGRGTGPSGQARAEPPAPATRVRHGPPTDQMARLSVDVEPPRRLADLEEEDGEEEQGPMDVDDDEGSRGSKRKRGDDDAEVDALKRKRATGDEEYHEGEDELEDEEEEGQKPTSATQRRAAGTKKSPAPNKGRNKPVPTNELHVRPCDRCKRLSKDCTKQQSGDACLPCARGKAKCGWDDAAPVKRRYIPGRPVPPTAPAPTAPPRTARTALAPTASSRPAPRPGPPERIRPTSPLGQEDDSEDDSEESEPVRKVAPLRRKEPERVTAPAAPNPAPTNKGKGKGTFSNVTFLCKR